MGETVTLTADAASGYYFKGWEAVAGGVIMNGGRFIMPGENVVVKAVFEKDAGNGRFFPASEDLLPTTPMAPAVPEARTPGQYRQGPGSGIRLAGGTGKPTAPIRCPAGRGWLTRIRQNGIVLTREAICRPAGLPTQPDGPITSMRFLMEDRAICTPAGTRSAAYGTISGRSRTALKGSFIKTAAPRTATGSMKTVCGSRKAAEHLQHGPSYLQTLGLPRMEDGAGAHQALVENPGAFWPPSV